MSADTLGFELQLEKLEELTRDPGALLEFRADLDRRAIARIRLATPATPDALAAAVDSAQSRCVRELRSGDLHVWDNLSTTPTTPRSRAPTSGRSGS